MSFSATIYRVLIASPSDVQEERAAIARAIHEWNTQHSIARSVVLLPVMWETHSAPLMGDRPQAIINQQVVRSCDFMIATFWSRLGSPTGEAESGTIEEINWFSSQKMAAMVYFSVRPIPNNADFSQAQRVRDFRKTVEPRGLTWEYDSVQTLETLVLKQVSIVVDSFSATPTINVAKVRKAARKAAEEVSESQGGEIYLANYTEKAFVVVGDTTAHKELFRSWNGKWMKARDGRYVWMFAKKSNLDRVAEYLNLMPSLGTYPE